jgi:YesN/AraC family two-component response regulator
VVAAQLAQHLQHDYSFLSKLFSEVEGITIEQYILQQKIEKVKELLSPGRIGGIVIYCTSASGKKHLI